jgi:hypothetical protein
MSATTDIYVTPSTSLILIRNVSTPTNIYLSSFNTPNFTLSVRDTTGSSTILTSSVYLSTIGTARFMDGSFLYTLNQPYGFVNLGFRNSSFWQVLHTSGQSPLDSAATVGKLNISTSYVGVLSTTIATISSLSLENLTTTNAITIDGPFIITNLSAPGIVTVQSTFTVLGDVQVDGNLFVSGTTYFHSSLTTTELLPLSNVARVFSSFGVGGHLSVGGTLTIGSTLFTQSDNFVPSLQVQKSTLTTTTTVDEILNVGSVLSSLRSLVVQQTASFPTSNQFVSILQDVSSIVSDKTFSTNTLSVFGNSFVKGSLFTRYADFYSSLFIGSTLRILSNANTSTLFVGGNYFTNTLSVSTLSTLSSFSTGIASVRFSTILSSGLSTTGIDILHFASISKSFETVATISSLGPTRVKDTLFVQNNGVFDSLIFLSDLKTEFVTASTVTLTSISLSSLNTTGNLTASGIITIEKGLRVYGNGLVRSNVIAAGTSVISTIETPSYLIDTLNITTSSPYTSFTASSFNASTVEVNSFVVRATDPPTLTVGSTFASTTQFNTAVAEAVRVRVAQTSSLFWGPSRVQGINASLDVRSYFPQGLSAQTLLVNSLTADFISSRFFGDGQGISNIFFSNVFSNVSATTGFVSTISSPQVFTSSLNASTFQNVLFTTANSSFQSQNLVIEGLGYPFRFDKNQILLVTSNLYAINRTLFIDTLQNRVGVNISSPQVDMDISGGLYAPPGQIRYSTINDMVISSFSNPTYLSSVITSYIFVRDSFNVSSSIILMSNLNPDSNLNPLPAFVISSQQTGPANSFSVTAFPSSIALMNTLFINNDTKNVRFTTMGSEQSIDTSISLAVSTMYVSSVTHVSSFVADSLLTNSLTTPYFLINPVDDRISVNTISTGSQGLFFNYDILTVINSFQQPRVGIKTKNPLVALDIHGSAYFSSLYLQGPVITRNLSLGSVLL